MSFLRLYALFVAVLLLPLGMAVPAGAMQQGRIAAAERAPLAAGVPAQSRASALAARRALVRKELAARRPVSSVPTVVLEKQRRLSPAQLNEVAARVRSSKRAAVASAAGHGRAEGSLQPLATAASTASSSDEGIPLGVWVTGADGGAVGTCVLCGGGGVTGTTVYAGEQVTATAEIYHDPSDSDTSAAEVSVTFEEQCPEASTPAATYTQTVSAPSFADSPRPEGALVSWSFPVTAACPDAAGYGDYAFDLFVQATPVSPNPLTGGWDWYSYWSPVLPVAQLAACDCSADSAAPGSEVADAGDPVDTVSGAYADTFTDATLKTPGYPLVISRSYSSANAASGSLGPGWSLPWEAHLTVDSSTGIVTFTAENGDQYMYTPHGLGGFYPPPGARSVLAATTDSSGNVTGYTLTAPDQHVLKFTASGQLTAEVDATGRGLSFAYNSGQLSSITDAAGHVVSLTYTGSLLTQVALPDGQNITYTYTNGMLTGAGTPGDTAVAWTYYTYSPAGLLASVQDPDGNYTARNIYDPSSSRVTSQEDGAGNFTYFSYTTTSSGLSETDVTDPNGGITSYLYGGNELQETIDPLTGKTMHVYNGYMEPVQVTDPLGNITTMTYDSNGNKTSQTDPLGNLQQWTYDSKNNQLTATDANGNKTTWTYNSMDEPLTKTTALGKETSYTYDSSGNLTAVTDPDGNTTSYAYNAAGQMTSQTNGDGGTTSYTYDLMGYPLTVTGPAGKVGGTFFPVAPLKVLDTRSGTGGTTGPVAPGSTVGLQVAGQGGVPSSGATAVVLSLTAVSPAAAGWLTAYADGTGSGGTVLNFSAGQSITNTVTVPVGSDGKVDFTVFGGSTQLVADVLGYYSTSAAGGSGFEPVPPLKVLDTRWGTGGTTGPVAPGSTVALPLAGGYGVPSSGATAVVLSLSAVSPAAAGWLTAYADGTGSGGTVLNFSAGQSITNTVTVPVGSDGKVDFTVFGGSTQLVADVDGYYYGAPPAPGSVITYAYNAAEELVSQKDSDGNITKYAYDADGRKTSATDPAGNLTAYAYDADGRLKSVTTPGGVTKYGYDGDGNQTSRTDPDGNPWTSAYDPDGHLSKTTDPLGHSTSYTYDADGNPHTTTDANGVTTTTTYDAAGRPVKITYSDGTPTVTYTYDNDGNQTAISDGTGTRSLGYDKDGHLTSAGGFTYGYNGDGDITSRKYPDGTAISYGYDAAGNLTSLTTGSGTTSYTYDAAGNLLFTAAPNGVTESRTYDPAGQLTGISDTTSAATLDSDGLTLDPDGRPKAVAVTQNGAPQPARSYGYNPAGQLTSACTGPCSSNQTSYNYDPAGNLTSTDANGTTTTDSYNADEELTGSVTGSTTTKYSYDLDGNQTSNGTASYTYNGAGELAKATTTAGTYTYSYDSGGNLTTTGLSGSLVKGTVWDLNNPLPMAAEDTNAAGTSTADYAYSPAGALASMTTTAGTYTATTDWLGSVTGLVNSSGTQVSTTTYSPYGIPSTTGSPVPAIGYAGSYTLPGSTGLDDMRARDYNPSTAAFQSVDPLAVITDQPYTYAGDSPISSTDPSGEMELGYCLSGIASAGIAAFASLCAVLTFNPFTGEFQVGGTVAPGTGPGMFALGLGIGPQVSNADQVSDLGGWFGTAGGSVAFGPKLGGDVFTGQGACNQQIWGEDLQRGFGVDLPEPIPAFEIHGGPTYTWQTTFYSLNVYHMGQDIGFGVYKFLNWAF